MRIKLLIRLFVQPSADLLLILACASANGNYWIASVYTNLNKLAHACDKLEAYKDRMLQDEEIKGLCKVDEDANFMAPHAVATLPKFIPRIFTMNTGGTAKDPDWGEWFEVHEMTKAAALANMKEKELQNMSSNDVAKVRHIVFFRCTKRLYHQTFKR